MSQKLTKEHFSAVKDLLYEVRSKYENLGFALGLLPGDIKAIKKANQQDVDGCYSDVLEQVLKNGITREELAKALESPGLQYGVLARKVRKTHIPASKPQSFVGQSKYHSKERNVDVHCEIACLG